MWFGRRCLLLLVALVAPLGAAEPPETVTVEEVRHDIETLRLLVDLKLSPELIRDLENRVKGLEQLRAEIRRRENDPAIIAIWLRMRATVAAGKPIPEELENQLEQAREEVWADARRGDEPYGEDLLWQRARAVAEEIVALLNRDQRRLLANPYVSDWADNIMHEIGEHRARPPADWQRRVDEMIRDITGDNNERKLDEQALRAVFAKARKLPPDDFFAQRPALVLELRQALLPDLSEEELREEATGSLHGQCAENDRLGPCLRELLKHLPK